MRFIVPILLSLALTACGDDAPRDLQLELQKIARHEATKALARLGDQLLQNLPQSPDSATGAAPLVSRATEVGHRDFVHAKKVLPRIFTGELHEEFYCGCDYTDKKVNWASCGFKPRKNPERAARIEWEHIVPAWNLGHQRQCWQQGGRKQCAGNDPVFQTAEGDLVNLVPAVGEVNGDRSNFGYGAWTRNPTPMYGQCQTIVDFQQRRAQPREEVRGRIARTYLYMYERYGLTMSRQEKQLMCAWAKTYAVDGWETERDRRITRIQGNGNRFVSDPKAAAAVCAG
ncbi:endonuclease [Jeongeupia sp. HS-3]|uniref:endonuclease n=1 Tax=Jeongeupia sp. HS-3 TaxID=1009682 RepID=UPI0018A3F6C3|nr:endonuclease [Jeongeupia sp. HS-3]BCL74366.1 endonuclease [Jeongeupia sp. HS-3]